MEIGNVAVPQAPMNCQVNPVLLELDSHTVVDSKGEARLLLPVPCYRSFNLFHCFLVLAAFNIVNYEQFFTHKPFIILK